MNEIRPRLGRFGEGDVVWNQGQLGTLVNQDVHVRRVGAANRIVGVCQEVINKLPLAADWAGKEDRIREIAKPHIDALESKTGLSYLGYSLLALVCGCLILSFHAAFPPLIVISAISGLIFLRVFWLSYNGKNNEEQTALKNTMRDILPHYRAYIIRKLNEIGPSEQLRKDLNPYFTIAYPVDALPPKEEVEGDGQNGPAPLAQPPARRVPLFPEPAIRYQPVEELVVREEMYQPVRRISLEPHHKKVLQDLHKEVKENLDLYYAEKKIAAFLKNIENPDFGIIPELEKLLKSLEVLGVDVHDARIVLNGLCLLEAVELNDSNQVHRLLRAASRRLLRREFKERGRQFPISTIYSSDRENALLRAVDLNRIEIVDLIVNNYCNNLDVQKRIDCLAEEYKSYSEKYHRHLLRRDRFLELCYRRDYQIVANHSFSNDVLIRAFLKTSNRPRLQYCINRKVRLPQEMRPVLRGDFDSSRGIYSAAIAGDMQRLREILQTDELLKSEDPHVVEIHQREIKKEYNYSLVEEDKERRAALWHAVAKGDREMVSLLQSDISHELRCQLIEEALFRDCLRCAMDLLPQRLYPQKLQKQYRSYAEKIVRKAISWDCPDLIEEFVSNLERRNLIDEALYKDLLHYSRATVDEPESKRSIRILLARQ